MHFIDMLPAFKFHKSSHTRRGHGQNHGLKRIETYISLKMNFLFSYFQLKINQFLIFNSRYNSYRNVYKYFYGSKIFLMEFLRYNNGHYIDLLILY